MKRLILSALLLFSAAAVASPGAPMAPQSRNVVRFAPINVQAAAAREKLNPPESADEIEDIDVPQPPPPKGRNGVAINHAGLATAPANAIDSATSFGTGISPGPMKTFKAEFLTSTSIPPDTMGAAGTTHTVAVTNDRMRIQTRDGVEVSRLTLTAFWAGVTIKGAAVSAFDPKIFFDRFNSRFILISSGNGTSINSGAMFAVSATADPTGTWYRWSVAADPTSTSGSGGSGRWIDYPSVGHNKNWIVVNENVFQYTCSTTNPFPCSSGGFWGTQIYVLDKQAAYSNTLGTINLFEADFNVGCLTSATPETALGCGFTMAPAITEDNTTDTEYMAEDWDSTAAQLRLSKITGTPAAPTLTVGTQFPQSTNAWRFDAVRISNKTTATVNGTTVTSSGGYMPQRQQAANLTSGTRIMANDSRVQNCVLRNAKLWCTHTVMLSATAQAAGTAIGNAGNPIDTHSAIQWWSIDPSNESGASFAPLQRGRIEDPAADNCHDGLGGQNIIAGRCTSTGTQIGEFFAFPNISVNQNDDVFIGFTRFSPLTYPNSSYAIRRASDPPNTTRDVVVFRPGQANYNIGAGTSTATHPAAPTRQNRWGDYSAAQTDPLNDTDFWSVQEYAGTVRDFGIGLAGNWETWWALVRPTATAPTVGSLIISEFRLRGPQGVRDEFVELYNPNTTPVVVAASDGSEGWALGYSNNGTTLTAVVAVVPNGTVIPPHGHFLIADNPDSASGPTLNYSLNGAAATLARGADSDTGWSFDLADNGGIALFTSSVAANLTAGTRLDSVGFSSIAAGLFKEGTGIAPITAVTPTGQMTFYRALSSGVPSDTGANENDFVFVDPVVGETLGGAPRLGAAGPENLDGPTHLNGATTLPATLLDTGTGAGSDPNRLRDATVVTNGAFGTLSFRRSFTNNTGADISGLRLRVVGLTTSPPGGGNADLRVLSAGASVVSLSGGGTANVAATTLEVPPTQSAGGGLNASLKVPAVSFTTPLSAGASINLQITTGVQATGNFNLCVFPESNGASDAALLCFTGTTENLPPVLTPGGPLARTAAVPATSATIATVSDNADAAGGFVVTALTVPTGITVTNIVNTGGTITADVGADCSAVGGTNNVILRTIDSEGAVTNATLVVNVTTTPTPAPPTISGTTNGTGTQDQTCPEQPLTLNASTSGAVSYQWYRDTDTLGGETNASTVVTSSGTYSVTATNACGTSLPSTGYIVQNPTPHTPFLTAGGPTTFCAGGSVTLMSNSATGIQWYKDTVLIVGAGSQNYVATSTGSHNAQLNALGCHSQFGNAIAVTVNPLPPVPTVTPGGPTTFYAGGSVTLTSSSASGNQWYLNGNPIGGATNNTFVATSSGSYTVTTTSSGCSSSASASTVVTVLPPQADLALTLNDNTTRVMVDHPVNYIIQVTNAAGPSAVSATVTDAMPAGLTNGNWVCIAFGGATCANGIGNTLSDAVTLPVGSAVAYVYSATVVGGDANDHLSNTASVAVTTGTDPAPANNSQTDTDNVSLFIDGFEGVPLTQRIDIGNGSDLVSATVRVDANLLNTLGLVPTAVAVGRDAAGHSLFTLELARFGSDIMLRAQTRGVGGANQFSTWQRMNLDQNVLKFAWRSAAGGRNDGSLEIGSTSAWLLLSAHAEQNRLTQLWVSVENGVPWLVPITD